MQQHQARHIGHASLPLSIYTIYKAQSTLEPHLGQTYSSTGQGAHQARISASQHIYDIQSTKHTGAAPWADVQQHRARRTSGTYLCLSAYIRYTKHKAQWSHTLGRHAAAPSKAHWARITAFQHICKAQSTLEPHLGKTCSSTEQGTSGTHLCLSADIQNPNLKARWSHTLGRRTAAPGKAHIRHVSLPLSRYTEPKPQSTLEPHLGQTYSSTGQVTQGTHLCLSAYIRYTKHKAHWSHTLGRRAAAPGKAHRARISSSDSSASMNSMSAPASAGRKLV